MPVAIDLGHCACELAAGHRLRLTLAGSDIPEFVPAPGTGEHRWLFALGAPNLQAVHFGPRSGPELTLSLLSGEPGSEPARQSTTTGEEPGVHDR